MSQPITLETMRTKFLDTLLAMEHKPVKSETKVEIPKKDGVIKRMVFELHDKKKVALEDNDGRFCIRIYLGRRTPEDDVSCLEDIVTFINEWIGQPDHVHERKNAEKNALRARLAPEVCARVDLMFEELLPEHGSERFTSREEKEDILSECIREALDARCV